MKSPIRVTTSALENGRAFRDKLIRKWSTRDNIGWMESAGRCFPTLVEFSDGSNLTVIRVVGSATT